MLGEWAVSAEELEVTAQDASEPEEEEAQEAGPGPSLWGWGGSLAGTLAAAAAAAKKRTAEVVTAVQTTDWRAELSALQEGLKEEGEEAVCLAKHAAEQLPAAVEHLPENATSVARTAQQRLEAAGKGLGSLGHRLVHGTNELFEQINTAIQTELGVPDGSGASAVAGSTVRGPPRSHSMSGATAYSRFDADVGAMQRDSSTYCDEPEDEEDYAAWAAGFDLAACQPDIDRLVAENTFMRELQARIVPLIVEHEVFWSRYFYRLHRLQLKHQQIEALTQRSLAPAAGGGEEELGWGSEEEEESNEGGARAGKAVVAQEQEQTGASAQQQAKQQAELANACSAATGPAVTVAEEASAGEAPAPAVVTEPLETVQQLAQAPAGGEDSAESAGAHSTASQASTTQTSSWQEVGEVAAAEAEPDAGSEPEAALAPAAAARKEEVAAAGSAAAGATKAAAPAVPVAAPTMVAAVAAGVTDSDEDLDWGDASAEDVGAAAGKKGEGGKAAWDPEDDWE